LTCRVNVSHGWVHRRNGTSILIGGTRITDALRSIFLWIALIHPLICLWVRSFWLLWGVGVPSCCSLIPSTSAISDEFLRSGKQAQNVLFLIGERWHWCCSAQWRQVLSYCERFSTLNIQLPGFFCSPMLCARWISNRHPVRWLLNTVVGHVDPEPLAWARLDAPVRIWQLASTQPENSAVFPSSPKFCHIVQDKWTISPDHKPV